MSFDQIRCETNLAVLKQPVLGTLVITSYKIVFRPQIIQENIYNPVAKETRLLINKPYIAEFFTIPHGLVFSVEARTTVKSSNKPGDSFVELVTKDGRQLKLIVNDPVEGERIQQKVKDLAFLDSHGCGKTSFKLAFTYAYFKAITGHYDGPAINFDRADNEKDRIIEANKASWKFYADPIEEFHRQGV